MPQRQMEKALTPEKDSSSCARRTNASSIAKANHMNGMSSVRPILRLESIARGMRYPLITSVAYLLGAELAFLIGTLSDKRAGFGHPSPRR